MPRPGAASDHRPGWPPARAATSLLVAGILLAATACGGSPTATVPQCGSAADVAPGDSIDGTLGAGDTRFDGAFIDYYTLELDAARQITIAQASADFDPLILVFDADGEIIAQAFQHDGSPPGTLETATMTRAFDAGCFLIGASVWDRGDTGVYTLTIGTDDA